MSLLRSFAQTVRHAPVLRRVTPIWDAVRGPYRRAINGLYREKGVTVRIGGVPLKLHPDLATHGWETSEVATYEKLIGELQEGDVFVDIGAFVGTFSILAAKKVLPKGRVIAYEPSEQTQTYLRSNLCYNDLQDSVLIRQVCCGAERGISDFYFAKDRLESKNSRIEVEGLKRTTVPLTTLDADTAELGIQPSFIKIDVEGSEWDVLHGAECVLRTCRPRLLLSLHRNLLAQVDRTPEDVLDFLAGLGYVHELLEEDHEIHMFSHVPIAAR